MRVLISKTGRKLRFEHCWQKKAAIQPHPSDSPMKCIHSHNKNFRNENFSFKLAKEIARNEWLARKWQIEIPPANHMRRKKKSNARYKSKPKRCPPVRRRETSFMC
jgi:hypothetical protein